jgi:hypothetical protein
MLDRFLSEENAQEKNKLLYGLGNSFDNLVPQKLHLVIRTEPFSS